MKNLIKISITLILFGYIFFIGCVKDDRQTPNPVVTDLTLNPSVRLPSVLKESSGITITTSGKIWSHNDSGNENKLYCFNLSGNLLRTITITNVTNNDWEDLAMDNQKRIYINDAGNNNNSRTNLAIYRIPDPETFIENTIHAEIINFTFEDQTAFPPPSNNRNFDVEAIIWHNDSIFMFTKDRSSPLTGFTKLYKIPAVPGNHIAKLADSIYLGNTNASARVTGANIHQPSGDLALLVQERLIIFRSYTGSEFFDGRKSEYIFIPLPGQVEAIAYSSKSKLYMTEEGSGGNTGYLYEINLPGMD
jgi:hypothetical protein